jgi:hypothetical protein
LDLHNGLVIINLRFAELPNLQSEVQAVEGADEPFHRFHRRMRRWFGRFEVRP